MAHILIVHGREQLQYKEKKMITYRCDLFSPSGYSKAARNHLRALIEMGIEVRVEDRRKDPSIIDMDSFWREWGPKVISAPPVRHGIRIWHETPDFFTPSQPTYDIGMVPWETSRVNSDFLNGNARTNWVAQMNKMDEMWTAATSTKEAFELSGVTVPIHVFPHPIDTDLYTPMEGVELKDELDKSFDKDIFKLLSIFQWNPRKNPADLLSYYFSVMDGYEDVRLFIKTYKTEVGNSNDITFCRSEMKRIKEALNLQKPPKLQALWARVSDEDMPKLYNSCDVYYALPLGEGFGLPFQEAMACGKPCIFPKSSSMLDFMDDEVGYGVDVIEEVVSNVHLPNMRLTPWYRGNQVWWKPTFRSVEVALKKVYLDWKSGKLAKKGEKARERIKKLHSFKRVGKMMKDRLDAIGK